eukprot:scaffold135380_cov41-Prasinocladus_malaysianus.AAC.1
MLDAAAEISEQNSAQFVSSCKFCLTSSFNELTITTLKICGLGVSPGREHEHQHADADSYQDKHQPMSFRLVQLAA